MINKETLEALLNVLQQENVVGIRKDHHCGISMKTERGTIIKITGGADTEYGEVTEQILNIEIITPYDNYTMRKSSWWKVVGNW